MLQEGKSRKDIAKAIGVSTNTINDRLTSKVWFRKLSGKDAAPLALKTIETLRPIKKLDTYYNGRQWKRIRKISRKNREIGNFFLFLQTVPFLGTLCQ